MEKRFKYVSAFAKHPYITIMASLSSIGSGIWLLCDKANPNIILLILLIFSLTIFIITTFYSVLIRVENLALKRIASTFHEINRIYQDSLKKMFCNNGSPPDTKDILSEELEVIQSICQRIADIFSQVINRECIATVKLIIQNDNKNYFAHTYARNVMRCNRDHSKQITYEVGTGKNTGFDEALQRGSNENPSHFFSPDLTKHENYRNERTNYSQYYKSAIVVPIRSVNKGKKGTDEEFDTVGFLCVDTLSVNRLNNKYHVQIMSSLASQMYDYMAFMRGKYILNT